MSSHTYITYSEVTGRKASENELNGLIASLNKEAAFRHLSMINNFLALFPFDVNEAKYAYVQRFLAINLLDEELYEKLRKYVEEISLVERPIFFRQQVLFLMKRILFDAPNDGGFNPDASRETKNTVGKLCLMISDFTVTEEQEQRTKSDNPTGDKESERVMNELLVQMLPVMELMNPPDVDTAIARSLDYINLSSRHFPEIFDGKSLSAFFETLTGISPERFLQMIVGVYSALMIKELDELIQNPANFNIRKSEFFSKLNFSEKEIDGFYKLTTVEFEKLKSEVENSPLRTNLQTQYDFTVFRKYPMFHLSPDILTPVDFSFLTEKASIGLFHTILNTMSDNKVNPQLFFQHWGYVFEKYVNNIFRAIYPEASNRFHPNTFFDTKTERECFDGIVEYPNSIIAMEYKGGLLNTKAKYSGDVNSLLDEMSKKFGCSKPDAAIKQLTTKIELLFHSNRENRLNIRGLEFPNVGNVYPVLIVNEVSLQFGMANWRLREWFKSEINAKNLKENVSVKSLMVLTIEDLEMIAPYLEATDSTLLEFVQFYSELEYLRFAWLHNPEHWYEPMTTVREVFSRFRRSKKIAFRHNQKMQDKWESFVDEITLSFVD